MKCQACGHRFTTRERIEESVAVFDHDFEVRLDAVGGSTKHVSGPRLRPTTNTTRGRTWASGGVTSETGTA